MRPKRPTLSACALDEAAFAPPQLGLRKFFHATCLLQIALIAVNLAAPAAAQQYAVVPISGASSDPYSTSGYASQPGNNSFLVGFRGGGLSAWNPANLLPSIQPSNRLWLRGEYLNWWTEGMQTPVLVTTSPDGTAQNQAAILGEPGVQTLFGGGEINDGSTPGLRLRGGFFLTPSAAFGIESEFFQLGDQDDGFSGGTGRSILGRPFFDVTNDRQTAQLIDFPAVVNGSLSIGSKSSLRSFMLGGRASLCPSCGGNCVACRNTDRVDWIVGYRNMKLKDRLSFSENLESLVVGARRHTPTKRVVFNRQ